jgi:hypothetical protein
MKHEWQFLPTHRDAQAAVIAVCSLCGTIRAALTDERGIDLKGECPGDGSKPSAWTAS